MTIGVTYNERSWAIDLIGHIKQVVSSNNRSIKDAGGEQTIKTDGGSLFPDVLLFGDRATALILQGWELKMPDTKITDYAFCHNATQKAIALGLDSFVLWNVSYAHLYIRQGETNNFRCEKKWDDLAYITNRESVIPNRNAWEKLAADIISYINDLFDRGTLEGRQFVDAYRSGGITSLIMENTDVVANALQEASKRDSKLKAEITLWWELYKSEYGGANNAEKVLAQANISNWIGKLLFAHILQGQDIRAQAVTEICEDTTPSEALDIFQRLSQECNFWTIFSDSVGLAILPERPWAQLKQLNRLLTDLHIGSIEQSQLSGVLEATVEVAVRKLRGQYPTPPTLARLLVSLCVQNVVDDRVLDPCCGSGTIPRAALEQKLEADVSPEMASKSVFAGDQDPQAVQISTFALAKPSLMHMPLRIFRKDAFLLEPEMEIEFRNPSDGVLFIEKIGKFNAIISNFPFVAQNGRKQYGNAIARVSASFDDTLKALPKTADVSAYLPFALYPLLEKKGRLGIIITNAWLGTTWGDAFFNLIGHYYKLRSVITSGAGRWFQNSDVVANILIMEKKDCPTDANESIDFVVLTRPLEELSDSESISIASAQIELGQTQDETMTIRSVSYDNIKRFHVYGLRGNAQFVNCDWVLDLPLVKLQDHFTIRRGERRGWNELFYPAKGHGIEEEYIRPLLKSSSEIKGYTTSAQKEAFCCSLTIEELESKGHSGAISWIERFKDVSNNSDVPLIKALARSNLHWYEMLTDKLTEFVMPLNPGNRIFVSRLSPPAFTDQRLTCFQAREGVDVDLCHALMNSAISMFMIEGIGFGRGLGVLDLSKDRIEKFMHVLDPKKLDIESIQNIKDAFSPLLKRDLLEVADELEKNDRKIFDQVVIDAFNLKVSRELVYDSLVRLVEIRQTATEVFE